MRLVASTLEKPSTGLGSTRMDFVPILNRPRIDLKTTPKQPLINPASTPNQLWIDLKSSLDFF